MDFDQGLAGPWCIVERGFELGRRDVVEVAVEAAVVVSVHPAQRSRRGAPGNGVAAQRDAWGLNDSKQFIGGGDESLHRAGCDAERTGQYGASS